MLVNCGVKFYFIFISILAFCFLNARGSNNPSLREVRYIRLQAIPCQGLYSPGGVYSEYLRAMRLKTNIEVENGFVRADRDQLSAFYLASQKLITETIPDDPNKCILRNIVPIPIRSVRDDIESSILAAIETKNNNSSNMYSWSGAVITDRDRGLYDNLSLLWSKWLKKPNTKKQIFESMRLRGTSISPYHSLISNLNECAGLSITGILIEVADSPDDISLSLGAAVLLSKSEYKENWKLTSKSYRDIIRAERKSNEAKIVDCHMDEALGLHIASNLPIYMAESLYNRVSIDGLLENNIVDDKSIQSINIKAPYFDNIVQRNNWNRQLEEQRARPSKAVKKLNEIQDANTFLKMRLSEKRACLRASGIFNLPRPREGPKMVDALMIPLLDEEVAYEVLRRLGETKGDYEMAAKMADFETRRPFLARLYNEARRKGDLKAAKEFVDEMNSISMLQYDPSNPEELVSDGFDIEEWYWEQRKRVYSIVA